MVIIWVMMIMDLLAFAAVSLAQFHILFATYFLIMGGGYLIIKAAIFHNSVMSWIDGVFGIYLIIVAIFHVTSFVYYLMLVWMLYKLIFTWAG